MTTYNSENSTLYSQSYENGSFFQNHDIENENTFSFSNETLNSFQDNSNPNEEGFFQRGKNAEENSFQLSLEEINPWNSLDEEDEEDKNLYFIKKEEKAADTPIAADSPKASSSQNIKSLKFIAIEEKSSKNESTQLTKKKEDAAKHQIWKKMTKSMTNFQLIIY